MPSDVDRAVKLQREIRARELCQELEPWLGQVAGADRDRFPDLLCGYTQVFINAPLALIEVEGASQLRLLKRLKRAGLLVEPEADNAQA